jgi:hypothetical protein
MLLPFLAACTGAPAPDPLADLSFALASADLGAPVTDSVGFDPTAGDALGLVLDAVLPVFRADAGADPAWDTPMDVWALLRDDRVQDPGVCPFERIDDGTSVFEGGCRSSNGYTFEGDVAERQWDEDGVSRYRLDADVEVLGDADSVLFDRVSLHGAIARAVPDDGAVDAHLDVNLVLAVEGYWERRGADPEAPEVRAWRAWTVSGTLENVDDTWIAGLAADIDGSGGVPLAAASLVRASTCPIEAEGEASLGEGVAAVFEGAGGATPCDACARVTSDAGETSACAPD